jgi:alpha-glucosidase
MSPNAPWWKHAVCYQVYIRSYADSDGDGVGDMAGITARLPHLADLGVDALWITPFYPSPQNDHGYDVADYCGVDPLFGSLDDADLLFKTAHELGIRVIGDLVPNHTSSEHPWFKAALASAPGSPERARYLFRQGRGDGPPNNWKSVFGGVAWTQVPDGEWYLHLFDITQPDLDWTNPEVREMFEGVLGFWLERGVDGFRIDVAHGLFKESGLPDQRMTQEERARAAELDASDNETVAAWHPEHEPMWDQPEVHEVYRSWRRILDSWPGDRMAVGEAWTRDTVSLAYYIRPDELHQAFNFHWLTAPWSAAAFRKVITRTLSAVESVGGSPTWVLSNHDVVRHPTRYGGGTVGLGRAKASTMAMLALPGSAYLYQGEELGLEEVDVPPEAWQDPLALRTGKAGRDGCRVPIPWSGDEPPYGFGPEGTVPWIPQPLTWGSLTVEAQAADPQSTLAFYRSALATRRTFATSAGDDVELLDAEPDVVAFRRGDIICHLNCGVTPVDVPKGRVLLCSGSTPGAPDSATWLQV